MYKKVQNRLEVFHPKFPKGIKETKMWENEEMELMSSREVLLGVVQMKLVHKPIYRHKRLLPSKMNDFIHDIKLQLIMEVWQAWSKINNNFTPIFNVEGLRHLTNKSPP